MGGSKPLGSGFHAGLAGVGVGVDCFLTTIPFLAMMGDGAAGAMLVTPAQVDGGAGDVVFEGRSGIFVARNILLN
jgi:hypothetical protein